MNQFSLRYLQKQEKSHFRTVLDISKRKFNFRFIKKYMYHDDN
jgi:hypothetical protein